MAKKEIIPIATNVLAIVVIGVVRRIVDSRKLCPPSDPKTVVPLTGTNRNWKAIEKADEKQFSSETSKHKLCLSQHMNFPVGGCMVIIIHFHPKYNKICCRFQHIIQRFYTVIFQVRLFLSKWKLLVLNQLTLVICNVVKNH